VTCTDTVDQVPDEDALITTTEAAKHLGISRNTLASYARKGLLKPALRLPTGQLRWTLAGIRRQLAEQDQPEDG
jgi:predicted site-specific integrase-resolvase